MADLDGVMCLGDGDEAGVSGLLIMGSWVC